MSPVRTMTVLVAVRDAAQRRILLGADTLLSIDNLKGIHKKKIVRVENYLIGVAGSLRDLQPLEFATEVFTEPPDGDLERHLVVNIAPAVRKVLQGADRLRSNSGQAVMDSDLLIVHSGQMFNIHEDFAVVTVHDEYTSLGAGGEVARGALYACRALYPSLSAEIMLWTALHAAAKHCLFVNNEDFQVITHYY